MSTPRVYPIDYGEYAVATPYDADFVKDIKDFLTSNGIQRRWDPEEKAWIIADEDLTHQADIVALVTRHFGDCEVES